MPQQSLSRQPYIHPPSLLSPLPSLPSPLSSPLLSRLPPPLSCPLLLLPPLSPLLPTPIPLLLPPLPPTPILLLPPPLSPLPPTPIPPPRPYPPHQSRTPAAPTIDQIDIQTAINLSVVPVDGQLMSGNTRHGMIQRDMLKGGYINMRTQIKKLIIYCFNEKCAPLPPQPLPLM